ncbi:hypothetical protein AAC387_Pa07g2351 [Persea americana]
MSYNIPILYYHEPRSGRRFRSRKEVEKFIQTGEVPGYKPKPKIEESNVENMSSQNSEPTPSSNIAWPLTLEFYIKHLPSFIGGGKSNQQSEFSESIRCMIPQDVHTMLPRAEIASLEPVQTVKRIVQVASLPPATPQAGHIL